MTQERSNQTGFTIIELMLAMAFIGMLLIAIAVTSMQVMNIYTKGITLREVNQVGRTISEDIQRTIAGSPVFEVGSSTAYIQKEGGGRLCTGTYTYAWNYGKALNKGTNRNADKNITVYNKFTDKKAGEDDLQLVKVFDVRGSLCLDENSHIDRESARELLVPGERSVTIQSFGIRLSSRDDKSHQAIYAIDLVIGTNDKKLNTSTGYCAPPSEAEGDENYCAVNKFSIIARSGNQPVR